MSVSSFSVSAPAAPPVLEAGGSGVVSFAVTNVSARPVRCQVRLSPQGGTQAGWLKIAGPVEKDLAVSEVWQTGVEIQAPPDLAPGSYSFRLDACATASPEDDYVAGPPAAFEIKAPVARPAPKGPPPWIFWAGLAILALAGGLAVWFILPHKGNLVVVPDFTRGNPDIALVKRLYESLDLAIQPEEKFDGVGAISQGRVVDQDPKAGQEVALGSTVKLYIQPPLETVPPVVGLDLNAAALRLLQHRLDMKYSLQRPRGEEILGTVVKQAPEEGAVVPRRQVVQLTVIGINRLDVSVELNAQLEALRNEGSTRFRPEWLRQPVNQ